MCDETPTVLYKRKCTGADKLCFSIVLRSSNGTSQGYRQSDSAMQDSKSFTNLQTWIEVKITEA